MSKTPSPEERAAGLVDTACPVAGGPWFIELRELLPVPVQIGPYQNPAVARDDAAKIRQFVVAVIREARAAPAEG